MDRPSMVNVERLDNNTLPCIAAMQRRGLRVDCTYLEHYGAELREEARQIEAKVSKLTGYMINLGSPDQVADLIFNKLGIKPDHDIAMTKSQTRFQVDDGVLEGLQKYHPCITDIQDYRECIKLEGTYCKPIRKFVDPTDGRLHPRYKRTTVETGRLAAEDPNVLGIPTRSKRGARIRSAFIAQPGWVMGTVDMSQIEIRWMAFWAKVKAMLDTFRRNGDIHTETSARIFFHLTSAQIDEAQAQIKLSEKTGIPLVEGSLGWKFLEAKSKKNRTPAKNLGLGVMYDISASGLMNQMIKVGATGWTEDACQRLIDLWFAQYPEVLVDRDIQNARVRRFGYVWDAFGRIRQIPEMKSVHKWIAGKAKRQAGNMPVQGGAQGAMKLAMAEAYDTLSVLFGDDAHLLLQVHDELVFECKKEIAEDVKEVVGTIIEKCCPPVSKIVEIKWGGAIGERWSDLEK
jgi:DNA polymerase-1